MTGAPSQSLDDFFAAAAAPGADGEVPRDHLDRPMIAPAPGDEHLAYKSGNFRGLVPYHRASSYGAKIDDRRNLELWQIREAVRGFGIQLERGRISRGPGGGMPLNPLVKPEEQHEKQAWNAFAEQMQHVAGTKDAADLGTAIHYGTEVIDKGGSLADLPDLVRERADAYWKFCREAGLKMTEIELFGVEDVHHVAGTWDRIGEAFRRLSILDVKTSGSLDFSGLAFAVQLAIYAHAKKYDPATQTRTPHDGALDLEQAWIIHVDRNEGGPVTLHRVDIASGWRWADTIDLVLEIRKEAKKGAIGEALDPTELAILRAPDRGTLEFLNEKYGSAWTGAHKVLATARWKELPA